MAIETDTITLPAHWACALINDDASGMTDAEIAEMDATLAPYVADGWAVVCTADGDDGEARFTQSYGLYAPHSGFSGGDVLDYVMHRTQRGA